MSLATPLSKLVRSTLTGSVIAAVSSLAAMAIELAIRHARVSGEMSSPTAFAALIVMFVPMIYGCWLAWTRTRQVGKGLDAMLWPEEEIRSNLAWLDALRQRLATRVVGAISFSIGTAWAIGCLASMIKPHPNPSPGFLIFLIAPWTWTSQLHWKLKAALPRPDVPTLASDLKPLYSDQWGSGKGREISGNNI